jgi:hypothetical protein
MKRWVKVVLWIVPVGLAIYAGAFFISSNGSVPVEFSEARMNGAIVAEQIVAGSAQSLEVLQTIAQYDRDKNFAKALELITQEVQRTTELKEQAIRLSSQLERMARSLSEIEPSRARVAATEAVGADVALVSRLVTYTDYLSQLFEALRAKFEQRLPNPNGRVQELVDLVNTEVRAINEFNSRSNASFAEFDKIVSR